MATKREISEEFFKWCTQTGRGVLVSVPDICAFFGYGKNKGAEIVAPLMPISKGTGKRYFYKDVVEQVLNQ